MRIFVIILQVLYIFQIRISNIVSHKRLLKPSFHFMFKVNNKNTRTSCEICSKLRISTPERRHWRHSGVFIVK